MPCQGNHDHAHPHDTAPHKPQPNPHPQGEAQEALAINNKARAEKHLNPLQWDDKLASDAQQWANHLAQTQQMVHSSGDQRPGQGENLFAGMGKDYTFSDGVNSWLGEEKDYHGEKIGEGDFEKWGHYTQCMWSSTTHIGMAKAKGANNWWYVVGRYSPPGNWGGQKPY